MVIVGSGEGATFVGLLVGTVGAVRRSAGATVVVVVVGTGAGSTGLEGLAGMLVEWLEGTLLVVVAFNIGAVAVRLTGTETGTGPATIDLIWDCVIMHLPVLLMHPHLL